MDQMMLYEVLSRSGFELSHALFCPASAAQRTPEENNCGTVCRKREKSV